MQHREIFAPKYFREISKHFDLEKDVSDLAAVRQRVADWKTSYDNGTIIRQSEIQLQKEFLQNFFAACLGYRTKIGRPDWELDAEFTTAVDGTRADGYLGFFTPTTQKTVAVIELKDATTDLDRPQNRKNDKRSPVEQAFSYVPKVGPDCRWVVVSNFVEIRLYHAQDQSRYEGFNITQLHDDEQLKRFVFLLHRDHLLPAGQESKLDFWHRQRLEQEQTISIAFYKKFKETRLRLFEHLRQFNPGKSELLLFEKTQKLLDRLIFVFFCEDKNLLPHDMTRKVVQAARASLDPGEGQGIWQQLKGLFRSIDKGNPPQNIHRYNGGLFAHDPELDDLHVGDGMAEVLLGLSSFDFDSDLDVNILGHIFEQSISDIEEIKAGLAGIVTEKKQGKRKKDGIFYTPEYITRYIVREAVGGWLDDRKRALGFYVLPELADADFAGVKMQKGRPQGNAKIERHRAFWTAYREVLAGIKVLDPACGSGAFLVQVFDYLAAEGQAVNDELARLSLGLRSTDDLSRNILTNNIFGVDINPESVEISKLSLWLKTADNQSELTALDRNIRCGNSLIDDPAVAGDLAFDWKKEFADIFEERGGFDVVVGNPPYVRQELFKQYSDYMERSYKSFSGKADLYVYFFERGTQVMAAEGILGFICSGKFFEAEYGAPLSNFLFESLEFKTVIDFGDLEVFEGISAYPLVFIGKKSALKNYQFDFVDLKYQHIENIEIAINDFFPVKIESGDFHKNNFKPFDKQTSELLNRINEGSENLESLRLLPLVGVKTGFNEGYETTLDIGEFVKTYAFGKDIKRYSPIESSSKIIFPYKKRGTEYELLKESVLGNLNEPLLKHKESLSKRAIIQEGLVSGTKSWFEYQQIKKDLDFDKEYIVYPNVSLGNNFTLSKSSVIDMTGFVIPSNDLSLLAILNSSLTKFIMKKYAIYRRGGYLEYKVQYLRRVPIRNFISPIKEKIEGLVIKMLALHRDLHAHKKRFLALVQAELGLQNISRNLENWELLDFGAFLAEVAKNNGGTKTAKPALTLAQKSEWLGHFEQERARASSLREAIKATDNQIDEMVFDLYGLTAEERVVVRGA